MIEPAEHDQLTALHGSPILLDAIWAGVALRLLFARHVVHPRDVAVYAFRDMTAAIAWTRAGTLCGHKSLGLVTCPDGTVAGVVDLRPSIDAEGKLRTNPDLADDWAPDPPHRAAHAR